MMNSALFTYFDPKSPISEVFRTLRTNIKFASLTKELKTIVFTSTGPDEGKSTVIANFAVTLCNAGSRVLLVDCDLRNPTLHKFFSFKNISGLTNVLVNDVYYKEFILHSIIQNLDVLTSGPKPPNPAEILGSKKIKELIDEFKKDYDYVLLDTPPVVVVTDAALLSSVCDGTVLVIASGEALIEGALKAKNLLLNVNANIIGCVLNKCKDSKSSGYYYRYYYDDNNNKKKAVRK